MSSITGKGFRWGLFIGVLIVSSVLGVYFYRQVTVSAPTIDGVYLSVPSDIPDFHFTDNKNRLFSKENLKHHWTFLFFGFTNCGLVCPVTLTELSKMMVLLGKQTSASDMPQIVFVTVDPDRDTIERLNGYVTAFNPTFIGLRGDESATDALEKALHIVAAKMESSQSDKQKKNYTIDHTAEILLINPDAKLQAYLSYPHQAAQMASDYKQIVSAA